MADEGVVRRGFAYDDGARAAQRTAFMNEVKGTLATCLFSRGNHQFETGRVHQLVRKIQRRYDERSHAAFHVARSTSVKFAASGLGGERIHLPLCRSERNGVDMPGEAQRRLVCIATGGRDDARALRRQFMVIDPETALLQQRTKMSS